MKPLEEISRPCSRKVHLSLNNIGRQIDIDKNHLVYDCVECSGNPGSCPNYTDHNALIEKYRGRR